VGRLRDLFRHSSTYAFGNLLARGIGILLLPVFTNYLSPEDYGVIALLFLFLAGMGILSNLGLADAFVRHFVLPPPGRERREVFWNAYGASVLLSLASSLLVVLFSGPVAEVLLRRAAYRAHILLCAGILVTEALCGIPFLVLRAREESGRFVLLKAVNSALGLSLSILLVAVARGGTMGVLWAQLGASLATFGLLIPIIREHGRATYRRGIVLDLLRFGLTFVIPGIAFVCLDSLDRLILERLTDLRTVGLYSAGYRLGMFVALVVAAFESAWVPFFLNSAGGERARELFARVFTYLCGGLIFLVLLLSLYLREITAIEVGGIRFLGAAFTGGLAIAPIILSAYLCYGLYVFFLGPLYLEKKTGYLSLLLPLGVGVNTALNLLLIPPWGMRGAAVATLGAYAALGLGVFLVSQRIYPLKLEWDRVGKAFLAGLCVVAAWSLVGFQGSALTRTGLVALFLALLSLLGFIRRDEWEHVLALVKRGG
jgi:O-antigen/teichoic acid export membrane protein